MIEMLSYPFILKALTAGFFISLCCSLLGVTLVLKRYSMIGDGLSHIGFGALSVASALNLPPLAVTFPTVTVAAFCLLGIKQTKKLKGDSAVALVSTASLALGVIVISAFSGGNTELSNYLFGSILAISDTELWLSFFLFLIVGLIFILFFNKIFAVTFDEAFSSATGINVGFYNGLIAFLTAVTVVLGMKLIGSLLISALIIFPSLTSMRLFKTFKRVTLASLLISLTCFFCGFFISYFLELPTGATIVAFNLLCYIIAALIGKILKR